MNWHDYIMGMEKDFLKLYLIACQWAEGIEEDHELEVKFT